MNQADAIKWLRVLNAKMWNENGDTVPLDDMDLETMTVLLEQHSPHLAFEPGTGRFGFGVVMHVRDLRGKHVITVADRHVFPGRNAYNFVQESYDWIERFTHNAINRENRPRAGYKDQLRDMAHYDY